MSHTSRTNQSSLPVASEVNAPRHTDEWDDGLGQRIRLVLRGQSQERVAEWSRLSAESVRRYLMGRHPSAKFLMALCAHEEVNGHWLLCGQGPLKYAELRSAALSSYSSSDLLAEIRKRIEHFPLNSSKTCTPNSVASFLPHVPMPPT